MMDTSTRILVCGGGNGAHTLAAWAACLDNVEVNVMTLYSDEAQRWANTLGDESIVIDTTYNDGTKEKILGKPRLITNDPSAAMDGVDAIFFVVPAFAHQQYFSALVPYLKLNTIVIGMPGQAGFEFQSMSSLGQLAESCAIISLESLPWACRILEFGKKIQILGFKESLGASVVTGSGNYKMPPLEYVQRIMGSKPKLTKTQNYIAVNLMAKSIIHPPVLYGKWKDWDGQPISEVPMFYQGVDDLQASLLSKVSDEVVATAIEIQKHHDNLDMSEVIHIYDWYKHYYSGQITDCSSLRACMNTNKAYDGLVHPMKKVEGGYIPDFSYRYISEDVPFGLVVMKGIAECVGVKTPTMDIIIEWGQGKLGKEYIVDGHLNGKDVKSTRAPQAYGYTTLEDLFKMLK